MNYGWLNVGSLVLGLAAWGLPLWYIVRLTAGRKQVGCPAAASLGCCAVSLWLQIWYNHHLVEIQDWSALLDTSGAVLKVAAVLLAVTLLLNAAVLWVERTGKRKKRETE